MCADTCFAIPLTRWTAMTVFCTVFALNGPVTWRLGKSHCAPGGCGKRGAGGPPVSAQQDEHALGERDIAVAAALTVPDVDDEPGAVDVGGREVQPFGEPEAAGVEDR